MIRSPPSGVDLYANDVILNNSGYALVFSFTLTPDVEVGAGEPFVAPDNDTLDSIRVVDTGSELFADCVRPRIAGVATALYEIRPFRGGVVSAAPILPVFNVFGQNGYILPFGSIMNKRAVSLVGEHVVTIYAYRCRFEGSVFYRTKWADNVQEALRLALLDPVYNDVNVVQRSAISQPVSQSSYDAVIGTNLYVDKLGNISEKSPMGN
jgi:hypothetical protein